MCPSAIVLGPGPRTAYNRTTIPVGRSRNGETILRTIVEYFLIIVIALTMFGDLQNITAVWPSISESAIAQLLWLALLARGTAPLAPEL